MTSDFVNTLCQSCPDIGVDSFQHLNRNVGDNYTNVILEMVQVAGSVMDPLWRVVKDPSNRTNWYPNSWCIFGCRSSGIPQEGLLLRFAVLRRSCSTLETRLLLLHISRFPEVLHSRSDWLSSWNTATRCNMEVLTKCTLCARRLIYHRKNTASTAKARSTFVHSMTFHVRSKKKEKIHAAHHIDKT
jgi:hypothetical protein